MLRGIYGDPERYKETYWSRFPGMYFAGDGAKRDEDGYFWLLGRVDDVMNVSGHRLSTTEIESALVSHPAVAEAAVVGGPDPVTGEAINAFVILRLGFEPTPELGEELRQHVATKISPIAKPKSLMFTPDLPKTRSGKIMRRLLRDIAQGRALGDTTTLADAAVVETIRENTQQVRGLTGCRSTSFVATRPEAKIRPPRRRERTPAPRGPASPSTGSPRSGGSSARMTIDGRLSDALNKREAIAIHDVQWAPVDGSAAFAAAPGLQSVDPYDLILVLAGEGSMPELTDSERAAHRVHKVAYDVALEVPPFRVVGTVHLHPGIGAGPPARPGDRDVHAGRRRRSR